MTEEKLAKAKAEKEVNDANKILYRIVQYLTELESFNTDAEELEKQFKSCFTQFDNDLPKSIREDRAKRVAALFNIKKKKRSVLSQDTDLPEDNFYKLTINCRYRAKI